MIAGLRIAGLRSVAELWRETYQRIEFQKPDAAFVERLIHQVAQPIAQNNMRSTLVFSVRGALQLLLMDEDREVADRLLSTISAHCERIASEVVADEGDPILFGTESLVWLAAARTMAAAAAPDRTMLCLAAESTITRLGALAKRKHLHPEGLTRLLYAAYAALLSGDLDLLQRSVTVRKNIPHLPQQWALLQSIAAAGRQSELAGAPLIRCDDPKVHAGFMTMFQLHRQPSNQHVEAELGREGLLAGGQSGGYLYAWIFLQSFAPDASAQSNWPSLRELLIG